MDRNVVIATVLIALIMIVWLTWLPTTPPPPAPPNADTTAVEPLTEREAPKAVPVIQVAPSAMDSSLVGATEGEERFITVDTDLYRARLSTKGATLVSFTLKDYHIADTEIPVQLVDTTRGGALSVVFTTPNSRNVDSRNFYYDTDFSGDHLDVNGGPATLTFTAHLGGGAIKQVYTFTPGTYEVGLSLKHENADSFETGQGYDLAWNGGVPFSEANIEQEARRSGSFVRSGGEVETVDLHSDSLETQAYHGSVDWIAVKNTYFTAVVIPSGKARGARLDGIRHGVVGKPSLREDYTASLEMPPPSAEADVFRMYLGPMEYKRLAAYDLHLFDTVDFGWDFFEIVTRPLAKFVFIPAFDILGRFMPNFGIVIIIMAFLIKLLVYPLTKSSYKSMARMRELQPKMEAIKEKYGDDPKKQQAAMMKMYKETGVNPVGGCLPMVLQYPVIIALWQFLPQAIEIRQQGFLWASDLSAPDVILHLPFTIPLYGNFVAGFTLLMGLSMIVQMRIQMTPSTSNAQAKIFTYVMPIMIFGIFNKFASGLSLYYLCYNVLTAVQQKFINKSIHEKAAAEAEAGGSKGGKGGARRNGQAGSKKGKGKKKIRS